MGVSRLLCLGNAFREQGMARLSPTSPPCLTVQPLSRLPIRWSSLSAIHAGRSREARIRSFGPTSSGPRPPAPRNRSSYAERRQAREAAPPPPRIIKGKKDIAWKDGPRPKSRQSRFYDPNDSFGKKSLVYQAKSGGLQRQMKELGGQDSERAETPWSRLLAESDNQAGGEKPAARPNQFRSRADFSGGGPGRPERGRQEWGRGDRGQGERGRPERGRQERGQGERGQGERGQGERGQGERPQKGRYRANQNKRRRTRLGPGRQELGKWDWDEYCEQRSRVKIDRFTPDVPGKTRWKRVQRPWVPQERPKPKNVMGRGPLSIFYTTAASQFLYGRSTVEAALQAARRKLYTLYIYGGANRQNVSQDAALQRLAERRKVEVRIVEESEQRLLDKMSAGRPHNGYVLEASPLPQLPLVGLGPVSEDAAKPGFHVKPAHQTAEDAAINGTASFVPVPPSGDHKPLVVVLDQILDPGNLGAILRTVSFLGASAVAITKRSSASLTPVALKASSGASETLTLLTTESLPSFLTESKESGWKVYAAAPPTSKSSQQRQLDVQQIEDLDPLAKHPCILVLGSEGEGLSRQIKSKADWEIGVPNLSDSPVVDSLNVSVAAGLLCSGFLKGKVKAERAVLEDKIKDKIELW